MFTEVRRHAGLIDSARKRQRGDPRRVELAPLSATTEEAVVGGVAVLISRRVFAGQTEDLEELLPELIQFALTLYLGRDEAARWAQAD